MTVLVKVSAIKVIGWYYIDGITQMVLAVAVWVTFLYPFFLSIAIHLRHPHTHTATPSPQDVCLIHFAMMSTAGNHSLSGECCVGQFYSQVALSFFQGGTIFEL